MVLLLLVLGSARGKAGLWNRVNPFAFRFAVVCVAIVFDSCRDKRLC
jgi:hypothetical protein